MSWNYRLVETNEVVRLREVYYDDDFRPEMMTTGEVTIPLGIGVDEYWVIEKIIEGMQKPILKYPFGPHQLELDFGLDD